MRGFWDWHIRFRLARSLIHLGLKIWPPSNSRTEVRMLLNEWGAKVVAMNAITRARVAAKQS